MTTENIDRSTRKARIAASVYRETSSAVSGLRRNISNLANTFLIANVASFLFAGGIGAMFMSLSGMSNLFAGLNADLATFGNAILETLYPALQKFLELPPAIQAAALSALALAPVMRGPLSRAFGGFVAGPGRGFTRYLSRLGRFFRLSANRSGILRAALKTLSVAFLTLPGIGKLVVAALAGVAAVAAALSAPVWLVIAAIAALAGILVLAWTKSERFRDAVKTLVADITKYAIDFVNEILRIAWGFQQWLKDIGAWDKGMRAAGAVLEWIGNMGQWVGDRIAYLVEQLNRLPLDKLKYLIAPVPQAAYRVARHFDLIPDFGTYGDVQGGQMTGARAAPQLAYPSYVTNNSTYYVGIGAESQRRNSQEAGLDPNYRGRLLTGGF